MSSIGGTTALAQRIAGREGVALESPGSNTRSDAREKVSRGSLDVEKAGGGCVTRAHGGQIEGAPSVPSSNLFVWNRLRLTRKGRGGDVDRRIGG